MQVSLFSVTVIADMCSHIPEIYLNEYIVIMTNRNDGQNYKNKTQVLI